MILLSLASKQIWPQVLAVAHLKPARLILLHSEDANESKGPAQRLKRFFDEIGLVPLGRTRLEQISDDDFDAVERQLDELQRQQKLPLNECVLHFTGGNKLMATAAFRWAARHARAFYLERRNRLSWFQAPDGRMLTRSDSLNGHLADDLDPVALLRCQLDASEVERPGQSLTLNQAGTDAAVEVINQSIAAGQDARRWMTVDGEADRKDKEGDPLEFSTAAVLLKLGVRRVQRGLRLKVKSNTGIGTRLPHAEIDLLFTWAGRLWLVDCKDRKPVEDLAVQLRRRLPLNLDADSGRLLDAIGKELSIGQTKALKEDLMAIREAGGLLGHVICVRKSTLPEEVLQFANHHQIEIVAKNDLVGRLSALLFPDAPASAEQMADLARTTMAKPGR